MATQTTTSDTIVTEEEALKANEDKEKQQEVDNIDENKENIDSPIEALKGLGSTLIEYKEDSVERVESAAESAESAESAERPTRIHSMSTIRVMKEHVEGLPEPVKDYIFNPVKSKFFSDREWDKFSYEGYNRENVEDVIKLIGDYAEEEAYFDIYQICSFDSINDRKAYKSSFVQAMLCLLLQLPSIIFIVYGEWIGSDKTWCNLSDLSGDDEEGVDKFGIIVSKCLAFGYSLYVSFYIEDMFANKQRGMRCVHLTDLENKPDFLNGVWLRIGGYYNNFASYCATIASFMIIFFAESQIDLVLNALALFFLIEIDDLLVTRFDYWKIKKFIDDIDDIDKNKYTQSDNNNKKNIDKKKRCNFWKTYQYYFDFPLKTIILFVRFIAPIYVGICS